MAAKADNRYGKPPKIAAKGEKSQGTSHSNEKPSTSSPGSAPKSADASGTGAVPVHERHHGEREEMMTRHGTEMDHMHQRQIKEHKDMAKRHMADIAGPGVEAASDKAKKTAAPEDSTKKAA